MGGDLIMKKWIIKLHLSSDFKEKSLAVAYDLNNEDTKHMSFLIAGLGALEQTGTTQARI